MAEPRPRRPSPGDLHGLDTRRANDSLIHDRILNAREAKLDQAVARLAPFTLEGWITTEAKALSLIASVILDEVNPHTVPELIRLHREARSG